MVIIKILKRIPFKNLIYRGQIMNKGEFVKAVSDRAGFTAKDTGVFFDAFVETLTETLKAGDKIQWAGFGTFELKEVAAKEGINPQTKAKVQIAACKKPVLKFGKAYKDAFNA